MKRIALGLMIAALCAVGCDDSADSDGAGSRDGGGGGDPVAETVEASEGGEVTMGGAEVDIPANALGEDTEITIEVLDKDGLPDSDNIASDVYDFGPDGTIFDEPVTLTIEFDASATPEGMKAVMAWLDTENDEWKPLADSAIAGNTVTATTDHFTPFAVILTAAGQTAGACEDLGDSDCGGDLTGTWEFSLGCLSLPDDFLIDEETGESPFGECPDLTFSATLDLTGTVTFEEDGAFAVNTMQDVDIVIAIPNSCIMGLTCSELGDDASPGVDTGDTCELSMGQQSTNEESGTYEIAGNTFITTDDVDMMPGEPTSYCVRGDTLTVSATEEDGTVSVFQATRQ